MTRRDCGARRGVRAPVVATGVEGRPALEQALDGDDACEGTIHAVREQVFLKMRCIVEGATVRKFKWVSKVRHSIKIGCGGCQSIQDSIMSERRNSVHVCIRFA